MNAQKFRDEVAEGEWETDPLPPRPDYQGWSTKYRTHEALVGSVIK